MTLRMTSLKPWLTLAVALLCCVFAAPASQARENQSSPRRTLALHSKDPVTWKIRPSGARGTLVYHEQTGQFNFAARKLQPLRGYILVRHTGTPPDGDLLARGTTNKTGELRLSGSWLDWTGKIWLVNDNDLSVRGNRVALIAWHPEQYLFEEKVLGVHMETVRTTDETRNQPP